MPYQLGNDVMRRHSLERVGKGWRFPMFAALVPTASLQIPRTDATSFSSLSLTSSISNIVASAGRRKQNINRAMSSTCFSRSSILIHIFPIPGRKAPPAAFHSFSPFRPVGRCGTSFALNPRGNRLSSCIRSMASEASDAEAGTVRSVPVTVAHELLKSGHRYLDVRTVEEFNGGHAVQAINIPYMFKTNSGMSKNPNFLEEASSTFNKDDEIIIGCLSGKRSLMAAYELSKAGFACVTDVAGGYSAWVQNGLPTEN